MDDLQLNDIYLRDTSQSIINFDNESYSNIMMDSSKGINQKILILQK